MRTIINTAKASLVLLMLGLVSCNKLTNLNINPNGTTPESANPSFLMTGVLTNTANDYLLLSYWDPFGSVMQYVQKDAFQGDGNYNWSDQGWDTYYSLLINNKEAYDLAQKENRPFIMGISLVMKSFIFGLITDLWGPAPYTAALNGAQGGNTNLLPAYDNQETIYEGILSDLAKADSIFSKINTTDVGGADVYYQGDAVAWDKFANSLRLRYYMRLSVKDPDFAKAGMEEVVSEGKYFKTDDDDATMSYLGTNGSNSWPENLQFDNTQGSNFHRIKMCSTLVDTLESYDDPRLGIWAAKVQIPIKITSTMSSTPDTIINGVRYIHPSAIPAGTLVDTGQNYVGLPPSISADPTTYNLNPTPGPTFSLNPHVSYMNAIYQQASGPLLKARLISCAEVDFILAEAALKGWNVGADAETYYYAGIKASLTTWGVEDNYTQYIANPNVIFNGTLQQIITQKWIANWTNATEAWCDWKRTGYPDLKAGPKAVRQVLPVRFVYSSEELNLNATNANNALSQLQVTNFSGAQGTNSPWSKPWILQGTNKPW